MATSLAMQTGRFDGGHAGPGSTAQMTWIPGGEFQMGSDEFYPEELPLRRADVRGFWIDTHLYPSKTKER